VQKYAIQTRADFMSSTSRLKPIDAKRLQAAKLLERGRPVDSVAETVGGTVQTVKHYKAMLDAEGSEKIERISVAGRKAVLDDKAGICSVLLYLKGRSGNRKKSGGFTPRHSCGKI
jgi:hypothetical protein